MGTSIVVFIVIVCHHWAAGTTFKCPDGRTFKASNSDMDKNARKTLENICYACWDYDAECSGGFGGNDRSIRKYLDKWFKASCIIHDMCYKYKGREKEDCD